MRIYDYKVVDMDGTEKSLAEYEGKVMLIVNSATECGFTPQYDGLQDLYEELEKQGLVILDFPCNQFGNQAPGSDGEIKKFCSSRFGVTFPMFAKLEVNGENQSELFAYLKSQKGFKGFDTTTETGAFMDQMLRKMDADYDKNSDIKWNFTKFLVDREGHVVERFEPTEDMEQVAQKVREMI